MGPHEVAMWRRKDGVATRLLLIRHGHSRAAEAGVVGGHGGCTGLSERGRSEVQALGRRLKASGLTRQITATYASVLPRAIESAEILAPVLRPTERLVTDCELCEIHEPALDGRQRPPRTAPLSDDFLTPPSPGAESYEAFFGRATARLTRIATEHPDTTVLVVTHAGVVRAAMSTFGASSPGHGFFLPVAHAGVTELLYDPPRTQPFPWGLIRFNDAAHFE